MEETKITKNTSMSGIISAVSKMQEMYPNEKLIIVSEAYWNMMKSDLLDKVVEKLKERLYYMETEEGWGGYTVTDKDIDEVIAEMKAEVSE